MSSLELNCYVLGASIKAKQFPVLDHASASELIVWRVPSLTSPLRRNSRSMMRMLKNCALW